MPTISRAKITLTQMENPKYNDQLPHHPDTNSEFLYLVERVVNTLEVHVNQRFNMHKCQLLIDDGFDVTIQPIKK